MKLNRLAIAGIAILAVCLNFTACKKDSTGSTISDSTQVQSDDETMANNETDDATNDATSGLEGSGGSFASRPDINYPAIAYPCDARVTMDTANTQKTITITYDGDNCNGTRRRTGKIIISFDASLHWKNAGAAVTITYDSLKIVRNIDGKTLLINGSETFTNVSGGLIKDLGTSGPITHTIAGNIDLTFNNGTQRTWTISKQRVFSYNNGIVLTTTGTGIGGIAEQGVNRYGNSFTSAITEPRVIEESCDFRLVSGQTVYTGPNVTVTVTFGLDASGNTITSCPSGFFYYKLVWQEQGVAHTYILPY